MQEFEGTSIIYAGDPLCSWCWGIAEELSALKASTQLPFHIVAGGLRPGTVHQLTDEERKMIRHHWVEVKERTGQPINLSFMDQKIPFVYDTEVPCRAFVTVRDMKPDRALQFFKSIQKKFYVDNEDTNNIEFYKPLIEKVDLNFDDFRRNFESEDIRKKTNDDFMWCRNAGANSFPTVILNHKSQLFALAIGYATKEKMHKRMTEILAKS